jgi:hypothetical protein
MGSRKPAETKLYKEVGGVSGTIYLSLSSSSESAGAWEAGGEGASESWDEAVAGGDAGDEQGWPYDREIQT